MKVDQGLRWGMLLFIISEKNNSLFLLGLFPQKTKSHFGDSTVQPLAITYVEHGHFVELRGNGNVGTPRIAFRLFK